MAEIGTVLGDRYRLLELLGQGGMATIYRAHDVQLDRDVAVKLLRPEYGRDPDFLARFRQEAQAVASLNHANVVGVYDYGQDPSGPFIVMELIDGEDLASILRRTGPLPPRQAARIAAEIARALAAAHARGIVHRDVKPANVLISRDGRVKVTDFGIARALAEAQMTLPGTTLGSVHYFSPEQASGEPTTESSDIFSLGIVLFEMLTGHRPWEGDNAAAVALARLSGPTPIPSSVRGGIPPDLEAIDRKALARDPQDRFASAAAMANALETFLAGKPVPVVAPAVGVAALGAAAAGSGAAGGPAGAVGGPNGPGTGAVVAAGAVGMMAGAAATSPYDASGRAMAARPAGGPPIVYEDDAYARPLDGAVVPPPRGGRAVTTYRDEPPPGTSPFVWIAGLLALLILIAIGVIGFQLLARGGPGASPAPVQVTVPTFVGLTLDAARVQADQLGIELDTSQSQPSNQPPNTILEQDPPPGSKIQKGDTVRLTVASGPASIAVPDLHGLTEPQAIQAILQAGLQVGNRTDAFDPLVPVGSVLSQDPRSGLQVSKDTTIDYVISKGPEPSPNATASESPSPSVSESPSPSLSPSPSPSPSPSQSPTPEPTPSPTPEPTRTAEPTPTPPPTPAPTPTPPPTPEPTPTPSPTPPPITVGEYRCLTLDAATFQITNDGFTVGTITTDPADGSPDGTWLVHGQVPLPGEQRPADTPIRLTVKDPSIACP